MGQRYGRQVRYAIAASGLALAGCMGGGAGEPPVTRALSAGADQPLSAEQAARQAEAAASPIISDLQARRSALPADSVYDSVAEAVLAANARAAEADLRSARLRAVSASKNWLPRIGPSISLTSLSDVVAQLVVEQVLFDNGRRKAERAFAKADVEVAAVALADDTNQRVLTALGLYLRAAEARERVALETQTLKDMKQFEWIMTQRVEGGVSDMSDLHVLGQKIAEIEAELSTQAEAEATAIAELNAMSARPLDDLRGLPGMPVPRGDLRPLDLLAAAAEKERDIARAKMERADLLPGLKAGGTLGDGGDDFGLTAATDQLLGLGTPAALQAAEAEVEAASRRVAQAEEDSNRQLRRLEQRLAALARQADEAAVLTRQARANLDLFQRQYEAGQRQVMDVVGVYETFAARQTAAVGLKYEAVLVRFEMARILGLLADGSSI